MTLVTFQKKFQFLILIVVVLIGFAIAAFFGKDVVLRFFAKASNCPTEGISAVQITANSGVVAWETDDVTQARVEYGTSRTNLAFTAPESTAGRSHNVPLTLLTPDTTYYYLIAMGVPGAIPGTTDTLRCDSSGQACTSNCQPWSFTTKNMTLQGDDPGANKTASPTASVSGKPLPSPKISGTKTNVSVTPAPMPTTAFSAFCELVRKNIGESSKDSLRWTSVRQYDIDGNGVINGLDVVKCKASGK